MVVQYDCTVWIDVSFSSAVIIECFLIKEKKEKADEEKEEEQKEEKGGSASVHPVWRQSFFLMCCKIKYFFDLTN